MILTIQPNEKNVFFPKNLQYALNVRKLNTVVSFLLFLVFLDVVWSADLVPSRLISPLESQIWKGF